MAKDTNDYEAIGKAVVLIASLFNLGAAAAVPQSAGGSKPKEPSPATPAASEPTPEAPKADDNAGNSQGLSPEAFTKIGIDFANSNKPTSGTQLKGILTSYGVERLSQIAAKDYDAFLEKIEEAKLA